ncbi:helix-turn-helix transcriptional regulator [Erysipelothrix rhusiopathiae]|uniref:helix-turn-helix domain-containing protein n=1 Tax=Erysipelothrix TaxID=1647 RepID=UPI0023B01230|nr:helix-turn-helix transcriptional regulator [Erysipelothrix sp. 4322-04]MDE8065848.1 helix-turn-helix transcriptional regulator [Erysipelothrix rhusiopathiae]MDE8086099.1 helix-turn-helix transcriptional regulator [Erysipelothrix rhusiopathiae]MDE8089623.1 helix-turn-helix transcriptional regulator [Erysipelothrix rhusiopathiae]MDE8096216.1 helix-turn-helix transcriptional regulator [Erysipelothrix rhusiopathiae]MDE8101386.1 helix-turn-helix transcriptional regulator [Erysipelothrix rhusiopa
MNNINIRMLRKSSNLTQSQMASKMGLAQSTYSQKEQGLINWTLPDFIFIKRNFNVKLEDIEEFKSMEKKVLNKLNL